MIPTRPIRARVHCPQQEIILVQLDDAEQGDSLYVIDTWRFGPNTLNPWPAGDFWSGGGGIYTERSWCEFPRPGHRDEDLQANYGELDMDYYMDEGL